MKMDFQKKFEKDIKKYIVIDVRKFNKHLNHRATVLTRYEDRENWWNGLLKEKGEIVRKYHIQKEDYERYVHRKVSVLVHERTTFRQIVKEETGINIIDYKWTVDGEAIEIIFD